MPQWLLVHRPQSVYQDSVWSACNDTTPYHVFDTYMCGNITPIAPPSRTCCTSPLPHSYGTRMKGVRPLSSPANDIAVASESERVECSRSMKRASKPAFFAIWTTIGFVTSLIPRALCHVSPSRNGSISNHALCHCLLFRCFAKKHTLHNRPALALVWRTLSKFAIWIVENSKIHEIIVRAVVVRKLRSPPIWTIGSTSLYI